jgi:DNA repair protein RecN (Recombination protein N)
MLQQLSIRNYTLIDKLEIDFYSGFTTITGETGAGKSIILDALSLIIGQRADIRVLKDSSKKCIIEGTFSTQNYQLGQFFEKYALDYDHVVLLRREINREGKSRAFINDTPVTLSQLKEIGDKLIDIHSQHSTLLINDTDFQLFVVDNYSDIFTEANNFKTQFLELKELKKELLIKSELERKSQSDADYYNFLFNELEQAKLIESEQKDLERELEVLNNIEQIKSVLSKSLFSLSEAENNCIQQINFVQNQLSQISKFEISVEENLKRLQSLFIELKDIVQDLQQIEDKTLFSPERLEQINSRLNEIYRLEQKHHVSEVSELILVKNDLDSKLQGISSLENQIKELTRIIDKKQLELFAEAEKISLKRGSAFSEIEAKSVETLKMLGMPDARIRIVNNKSSVLTDTGIDNIVFTFSANKGFELKEISRIASGGEISRLMLVFKSLVSKKRMLPTIIFDEIDSGMSGEVAARTGQIMKELSEGMQVFSITHLAQIAAKGDQQYQVYKTADKTTTFVNIKKLNNEERVGVLAEMLSGKEVSDASRTIAKQMLS